MTLKQLVQYLSEVAGVDDSCSVLINSNGDCFLGVGMHDRIYFTADELEKYIEDELS